MAFVATLTGTGRNCTLTSGTNSMVVASNTGLVVGATIQGTGIPAGSRVGTISGLNVTMVTAAGAPSNATVTGVQSLIFSSVFGSVLTVTLTASGDFATMQNIYNAGFGVMDSNLSLRQIYFPGGMGIIWRDMVAGSVFDFQNWTLEFGSGGYWAWSQSSILGELRGGYLVNGTQFIKSSGPTFISNNFKNSALGGANMFIDTATGAMTGNFRMNNLRVLYQVGSNTAPFFACGRMNCIVDNMILDYQGGSGPNAGIGAAFGVLNNTTIVKANSGIVATNGTNFATFNGVSYSGIFTDSPNHKFAIPNGYVMEGYAPQVLSTQTLGGFQDNTTETFANIDLSSAGWGVDNLKTRYQRFGGPNTINFPRRVTFEFNDNTGANLTGATLFIRSGTTSVINAVQDGDYSANTQALVLQWTGTGGYRLANTITDTINQVAQVRRYGFIEQSTSYSLNLAAYSQPFFLLPDTSLAGINEATAAAITTAGINWTTKVITPTANLTYDQINARIAWELAQTTNSAQADPRTISGNKVSLATGWSLIVNNGITISAGTNITEWFTPTITINGTGIIAAVYQDSTGTSTVLSISGFDAGSSVYVEDNNAVQKFYSANASGAVTVYIPPTATGSWYYAVEKYGNQRQSDFFTFSGGALAIVVKAIPDTGLTVLNAATVGAYTALENPDKIYDFVAFLRLSVPHISYGQIVFKNGASLDLQDASIVVNQSAAAVASFNFVTKLLTIKASSLATGISYNKITTAPPATITANSNEVITVEIEDANGDSSVNIQGGSGSFSIFKFPIATTAYPAAGVDERISAANLITSNAGNGKFRFLADPLYNYVVLDNTQGNKANVPKEDVDNQEFLVLTKGAYVAGLLQGAEQIALAQVNEVYQILAKVNNLILDNEAIKGTGFTKDTHSLKNIKEFVDAIPADVWTAAERTLTSDGASGATLAEIEASTVLAKEATSEAIKTKVDSLYNYNDAALITKIDAIKNVVDSIKTTVEDKTGYSLTIAQVEAIAVAVESHLLDEGDSKMLINAIVGAIGNTNVDQVALVAAIRSDIERAGGKLTALGTPLQASAYVAPDNAKIADTNTKVSNLSNYNDSAVISKIEALGAPLQAVDYVAPANAEIASIKETVLELPSIEQINESIENSATDLTNVPKQVWGYSNRTLNGDVVE